MRKSNLLRMLISISLIFMFSVNALAVDIISSGSIGTSVTKLTAEPAVFNVTVPTSISISMLDDGSVVVPTDAKVINNGSGPIKVTNISVTGNNGWDIKGFDTLHAYNEKVGSKKIAVSVNNSKTLDTGTLNFTQDNFPTIEAVNAGSTDEMLLSLGAVLPVQKSTISNEQALSIIFTVDWDSSSESIPVYELATDDDFSGVSEGAFRYIGVKEYIEIPSVIKGIPMTRYDMLFLGSTSIKGVRSDNSNIATTNMMFSSCKSQTLDVSQFNTSNVTSMSSMFTNCQATKLDLSNFDTSNVTFMVRMFKDSKATVINLSNFNTSKVTTMAEMFDNSLANKLDLSSFDTSNVTNMTTMLRNTQATVINLSSFNTSNVTSMTQMFANSCVTNLDLSNFDTSNVTGMNGMFMNAKIVDINLSSFNTSKVTNMSSMFSNSQVTTLDLSSFDMTNVTNTDDMFINAITTTGYARTQADADKLNASTNKPTGLIFTVKP